MTQENLDDFIAFSLDKLHAKSEALSVKIFNELNDPPWNLSTEKRRIEWSDSETGKILLAYRCVPIGSFNTKSSTWLWSWANKSIHNHIDLVKEISALPERFPEKAQFLDPKEFKASEGFANAVTAALVELYDAVSFYRTISEDGTIYTYFYPKEL